MKDGEDGLGAVVSNRSAAEAGSWVRFRGEVDLVLDGKGKGMASSLGAFGTKNKVDLGAVSLVRVRALEVIKEG